MTSVARINDMFGEEGAVRRQRRDARFINTCMMATISGAAVSDGLADGRVVSGVGGQYNFIAMAHELEGARSILLLRSTREAGGRTESNSVSLATHDSPHLRDSSDGDWSRTCARHRSDVAAALFGIADARFQEDLTARAKAAGKLPSSWRIPDAARRNTPDRLSLIMRPLAAKALFPEFPLGTDFDAEEIRLIHALRWLKARSTGWRRLELAAALGAAPDESERDPERWCSQTSRPARALLCRLSLACGRCP